MLELLLESAGEGIFGIDNDGACTFINRAGADLLGYARDEVLGRNMHSLVHHSHADGRHYPEHECPIFQAFREGHPCRVDSEVFWRKNGEAFAVEYSSHAVVGEGGVQGAVITFVDITERQRAQAALRRTNAELEQRVAERTEALTQTLSRIRELSAHGERVREVERTRIAREVHDELGSLLVALKMDVAWLQKRWLAESGSTSQPQPSAVAGKLDAMLALIDSAVVNVGRIITDLRPSILDHQGLWAALEWQVHDFAETAEIGLTWKLSVDSAPKPSDEAATAIFRIVQELLSNVGRHAHASHLSVQLVADYSGLSVTVQDNGRGLPAPRLDAPDSYGVMGVRERARQLNCQITWHAPPGGGCEVRLRVPFSALSGANEA